MNKKQEDYWIVEFLHPEDRKWMCIDGKAYSIPGVAYMIRNVYRRFGLNARMKKVKDTKKVRLREVLVYERIRR